MRAALERYPELAPFVAAVRDAYGGRLAGIYLFGSRARGDHRADSDYDVAVVLRDEDAVLWREVNRLADVALEVLLSDGIEIQAVPFKTSDWQARRPPRALARAAKTDAVELAAAS